LPIGRRYEHASQRSFFGGLGWHPAMRNPAVAECLISKEHAIAKSKIAIARLE